MNMLNNGLKFLENTLAAKCSDPVEYRQGAEAANAKTVNAVFGKTDTETDGGSFSVQSFVWDFLIKADDLEFTPAVADTIIVNGATFEVMNLGGEGCWRYTSPTRTTYRIHTREIS